MAETEPVVIPIKGKDEVTPVIKKVNTNLREMGEKISSLGMRMTGAITLPIVGVVAGLAKMGAEASKTVADLKGNQAEIAKLDPSIRSLAKSYDELQAMIRPVQAEFQKMAAELATALIPVLRDMMPSIMELVRGIGSIVKAFADLPMAQKKTIVTLLAIAAAVGPVITIVGQLIWTFGTITSLAPGLSTALSTIGTGFTSMLGPIGLVIIALKAIDELMTKLVGKDWFGKGVEAGKQVLALSAAGWAGILSGGNNKVAIQTLQNANQTLGIKGFANGGSFMAGKPIMVGERGPEIITPNFSGSVSPIGNVTVVYSPTFGMANQDDLKRIGEMVMQAQRGRPYR